MLLGEHVLVKPATTEDIWILQANISTNLQQAVQQITNIAVVTSKSGGMCPATMSLPLNLLALNSDMNSLLSLTPTPMITQGAERETALLTSLLVCLLPSPTWSDSCLSSTTSRSLWTRALSGCLLVDCSTTGILARSPALYQLRVLWSPTYPFWMKMALNNTTRIPGRRSSSNELRAIRSMDWWCHWRTGHQSSTRGQTSRFSPWSATTRASSRKGSSPSECPSLSLTPAGHSWWSLMSHIHLQLWLQQVTFLGCLSAGHQGTHYPSLCNQGHDMAARPDDSLLPEAAIELPLLSFISCHTAATRPCHWRCHHLQPHPQDHLSPSSSEWLKSHCWAVWVQGKINSPHTHTLCHGLSIVSAAIPYCCLIVAIIINLLSPHVRQHTLRFSVAVRNPNPKWQVEVGHVTTQWPRQ